MVTYILHEAVMGCFILTTVFLGVALNSTIRHK
ncbi:hypothetical protein DFR56_116117 [Pseudogracilibacillus auburnensis]|uniref:Uncharacterized protein n=1 Tax=Pseudogracilibacillus auburnensis TaxID=1494959 RepID=A0A2V3VRV6_9BACI|nr:hypothetical protein DFR56_116117 [Pseudogracilibacillus auburnensis]